MLEFIRVFLRENNTHSHLSIKNNVKSLILLMFLALCAKLAKKRGQGRVREGEEVEDSRRASTSPIKKNKTLAKNGGHVCKWGYDVNEYIYI